MVTPCTVALLFIKYWLCMDLVAGSVACCAFPVVHEPTASGSDGSAQQLTRMGTTYISDLDIVGYVICTSLPKASVLMLAVKHPTYHDTKLMHLNQVMCTYAYT
jgi:hypothetical protein